MPRKVPPYIKPAGWFKDTLAHMVDFLFVLVLGTILLFAIGRPFIYEGIFHASEAADNWDAYAVGSGFASFDEEGKFQTYVPEIREDFATYSSSAEEVETKVWHYFYDVVGKQENYEFSQDDGFYSPAEKGSEEYSLAVGKWVYEKVFGILDSGAGNTYFTIPEDPSFHYERMPVLNAETQARFDNREVSAAHNVFLYLYDSNSATPLYQRSIAHFNSQAYAKEQMNAQANGTFFSFYPSIIAGPFLFFFVIPMLSKTGKTLGKRFFGIMVISDEGYRAKKWQMLLHYALIFGPYMILLIQHPVITLPIFTFYYVIDYMIMVMGKNHQGFHCRLSKTVIAQDSSLVFQNEDAERLYVETHPNSIIAKTKRFEGEQIETIIETQETVFDSRDLERAEAMKKKRAAEREEEKKEE